MTIMNHVNIETGTVNIAVFNQTDAALAALREKYQVVPDANTEDGYAFVKEGIKELTTLRTRLEGVRKEVKEPYLQAGRIIDAEAKRITTELTTLEEPMKAAKKEVDDRVERERQERIARLQAKVDAIKAMPGQVRGKSSQEIEAMYDRVGEIDATHDFFDLTREAVAARQAALDELTQMLTERLEFEVNEKARLQAEAERAELQRQLKAQQEENDRILREQQAEMQRQQDEIKRQQQEMQRQQDEMRQQREELERAQAALQQPAPAAEVAQVEAPVEVVAVKPAPATSKAKPDNRQWHAVVTDKSALIAAIAAGFGTEDLLIVDQAALDSLANDKRNSLELPGVVAQPVPATHAA
ncbi:DUF1351 domain-containing protein [Ectopseudomonas oleovorans]|uniref:DUF1351 domain-containing protein n=1 Tax=Ectopseudomonas oleovorans TaxID=301 RepID=A0AA42QIZ0_ECTOL|nr:DUF1351 domain-containing protein [Pseudomonas oleovorans]MDH1341873.1 DUF1351 domain-containing protein [Pseudomonas oleovorans]MDH1490869.1 DUF1351 domain-containing protein [Pseudomonas oleovorans]WGG19628.1 DUF1351 domain-containing protein [Pseudomonas oleovorans]